MKFNYHIIILLLLIVRLFTPSTAKASQNYINNLYPSDNDGSPDKPGGLSIQLCKSEKKEFYIRYSS